MVPLGLLGGGVVGEAVGPDLLGGEVRGGLLSCVGIGTFSRPTLPAAFRRVSRSEPTGGCHRLQTEVSAA